VRKRTGITIELKADRTGYFPLLNKFSSKNLTTTAGLELAVKQMDKTLILTFF
jgi:hypothetical protein